MFARYRNVVYVAHESKTYLNVVRFKKDVEVYEKNLTQTMIAPLKEIEEYNALLYIVVSCRYFNVFEQAILIELYFLTVYCFIYDVYGYLYLF